MQRLLRTFSHVLSVVVLPASLTAQLTDDFSDGDFTAAPAWSGNDALFTVADGMLRSNSPGAATYALSTPSTQAANAQWEWYTDLRFSTSGANYVDMYLMSDAADLTAVVNGYFVRMGGTADRLELFKRVASVNTSLLASTDGIVNSSTSNPFRIRVTRDGSDNWTLFFDDGATGTFTPVGPVVDNAVNASTHFGVMIEQSSAASAVNNHFFDDFSVGPIPVDATPPSVLSVTAISATQVDVLFDEALDPVTAADEAHYDIQPFIGVSAAAVDGGNPALVHVTPALALTNGNAYQFLVSGVEDLAGNAMPASTPIGFLYFVPDVAAFRDVVINELMPDPSLPVGLPDAEFVELHNATTDLNFDLAGWKLSDGTSTATLPAYALAAGAHVIIVSTTNAPLFASFPNVLAVASMPSLNNESDDITLASADDTPIDAVSYELAWYQDLEKEDGGWTLEQIDPTSPCSGASNWRASVASAGGTPGAQNSIFSNVPDTQAPALLSVQVIDAATLVLVFNETMDAVSIGAGTYVITPGIGVLNAVAISGSTAQLTLAEELIVGTMYTITVTGVSDCPGNAIGSANTAGFALPEPVATGDVVINEVLYDPVVGGSDFVELYNRSMKVLSLSGMQLANVEDGAVDNTVTITEPFLMLPGEYALVTSDPDNIASVYPQSHTDRFVESAMPSYNNGEGSVVLLAPDGAQLDRFDYSDDLHFTLVNAPEGYSLERVDPERATSDPTNWQTAADIAGRATPGFRNSQYADAPDPSGEMTIEPAIFSPDNDGHQDVLTITYQFNEPGFVGTMVAYDVAGREARRIMDNQLLGTTGAVSWDGILDGGDLGRMGPYIIVFEVFDLAGNVEKYKRTVTLAHRLGE